MALSSSPVLKIRRGFNIKSRSPPAGGALKSPALGRVGKLKRRLSTPKRSYTPDQKQNLITFMLFQECYQLLTVAQMKINRTVKGLRVYVK